MKAQADPHTAEQPLAPGQALALSRAALAGPARLAPEMQPADPWADRLAEVLITNVATGRFRAARTHNSGGPDGAQMALLDYARQVLPVLQAEADRVARLAAGETDAWAPVLDRLERMAYRWLGPVGREAWAAGEARETAATTCADLWRWLQTNPYPFDVPFDRWAARALVNRLQNAARRRQRRAEGITEISLDRAVARGADDTLADLVLDEQTTAWQARLLARDALLAAIAGLPVRQAAVVRLWYLEQWRADEIAAHLGASVGAVYLLRCRGLKKLRRTWDQDRFSRSNAKPSIISQNQSPGVAVPATGLL